MDQNGLDNNNFSADFNVIKSKLRNSAIFISRLTEDSFFSGVGVVFWRPVSNINCHRVLVFTDEARQNMLSISSNPKIFAEIANAADRWVEGKLCQKVWCGREQRWVGGFIKRLHPSAEEVWEIKVTQPKKRQTRLFGRFLAPNIFVVCAVLERSVLQSKVWNLAFTCVRISWNKLGISTYFSAKIIDDYLKGTAYDDYQI